MTDKSDYCIVSDQSIDIPVLDSDIWYDCTTETAQTGENNLMDTRSRANMSYSASPSNQPIDPFNNRDRFVNMTDRNFSDNLTELLTRQAVALPATFHPVGGHKVPPLLSQLLHELETSNLADG